MEHGFETPFGPVVATLDDDARLKGFCFGECAAHSPLGAEVERQVGEYFAGTRKAFDLPLDPDGTPFQKAVWQELLRIPFGTTRTYLEIAAVLGNPKATRAVGAANGRNPIWLIVPCHRVIGSGGALTGYAGGMDVKERLLAFEGVRPASLFA